MDQLNFERLGIPTVTVATTEFAGLAKGTALSEGAADLPLVVVPHPMGMIPAEEIRRKADEAFPKILEVATRWQPSGELPPTQSPYPAKTFTFTGTEEDVNRLFMAQGWSIGLPIVPPTPERVAEMLKGTTRRPDEVLGLVPPRMGVLTVELVAVHAVMAGCKPEYMPVLIAAMEALLAPEANLWGWTTTTGTTSALVIVNGPIVNEIGIASTQGAAGSGHHANAAIGYAINLILDIVGGSKPPEPDKSTLGIPSDFVAWVFGENEAALPPGWKPLHVQMGFQPTDSVVTVMGTYPPLDNIDHWSSTPEEHMRWWARLIGPLENIAGPCSPDSMKLRPIVGLGPEHASMLAQQGWTQEKFRQALWEQARIPLRDFPSGCSSGVKVMEKELGPLGPDSLIPITYRPEQFLLVIAGGTGKHSHYFPPFPGCNPVSRLITK